MNKLTERALSVYNELRELFNSKYIAIDARDNSVEITVKDLHGMCVSWSSRYAMLKALATLLECDEIDTRLFRHDDEDSSFYGDEEETFICWNSAEGP